MAIMRTFLKWRTDRKIPCLAYLGQKPEAGCEGGSSAGEQGENLGFSREEGRARSVNGRVHLGVHLGYVDDREEWAETWRNWIT